MEKYSNIKTIGQATDFFLAGANMHRKAGAIQFGKYIETLNLPGDAKIILCEHSTNGCQSHYFIQTEQPLTTSSRQLSDNSSVELFGGALPLFNSGKNDTGGFISRIVR